MTQKTETDVVEIMVKAMKKRAAEPLSNIPSLEPVLVGSLGDAWPYLIRAALTALSEEGLAIVPVEPSEAMLSASVFAGPDRYEPDGTAKAIWSAMLAAVKSK